MPGQGTVIGRTHRLIRQNCHDVAYAGEPQSGYALGLVLDGCGSKYREGNMVFSSHNEVGARLLGQFAASFLTRWINDNDRSHVPDTEELSTLLDSMYTECLAFLNSLLDLLPETNEDERRQFVSTHLLCTLLGFLVTPGMAVFFWSGDGFLCRPSKIRRIESQNQPDYLAYRLLPNHFSPKQNAPGFHMEVVEAIDDLAWLAVATDGWHDDLLQELSAPRSSLELQRWLNQKARLRGNFDDDGAVAIWWRDDSGTFGSVDGQGAMDRTSGNCP